MDDGYITIKTYKSDIWKGVEDGEGPFTDFWFKVEGNYNGSFKIKKYILKIYEEHKFELMTNPDKYETESRVNIEEILKEDKF